MTEVLQFPNLTSSKHFQQSLQRQEKPVNIKTRAPESPRPQKFASKDNNECLYDLSNHNAGILRRS